MIKTKGQVNEPLKAITYDIESLSEINMWVSRKNPYMEGKAIVHQNYLVLASDVSKTMQSAMQVGYYGAPLGFPNHADFHFLAIRLKHFFEFIIAWFGIQFLEEVEA